MYFCAVAKPKSRAADILKERRCTTLYLWRSESRKFKTFHKMKQWPTPIMVVYTFLVYTNSVGFGIAYPWEVGNARASERGMSNSSDTRASFFGVFRE